MDTIQLIADTKARFSHNSAKAYLKDKYTSKLLVADQGGLWTAGPQLLSLLSTSSGKTVVIIDMFDNPVKVNRRDLLLKLTETYNNIMAEWHSEWELLEKKR